MTASELRHLFVQSDDGERYEGGRDGWSVDAKYGDVFLTVQAQSDDALGSVTRQMSVEDLDDLELAVKAARRARDAYRRRRTVECPTTKVVTL